MADNVHSYVVTLRRFVNDEPIDRWERFDAYTAEDAVTQARVAWPALAIAGVRPYENVQKARDDT